MTRLPGSLRHRGFTLIEVLVTLSMIGAIMTVIYTVLYTTLDQKRKVEVHVMASRVGPLLLDRIESDLHQLFAYNLNNGLIFKGEDDRISGRDADRIRLVVQAPSTSAIVDGNRAVFSPINEVGYVLTANSDSDEHMTLWRREDYFVDDDPLKGGPGTPMYKRVLGFDVKYYNVLGEDAKEEDRWDMEQNKGVFPAAALIKLTIEVESRAAGETVIRDEMDRREYTFKRWITFPKDAAQQVAVLPAVPSKDGEEGGDQIGSGNGDNTFNVGGPGGPGGRGGGLTGGDSGFGVGGGGGRSGGGGGGTRGPGGN